MSDDRVGFGPTVDWSPEVETEWSLPDDSPLWRAAESWVPEVRRRTACCIGRAPVARSAFVGASADYVRPPGHNRSFYVPMNPGENAGDSVCYAGPVIAVKGSEVGCDDAVRWAKQQLGSTFPSGQVTRQRSALDFFPLAEHKIAGAMTKAEAQEEVDKTVRLQTSHLERFGFPARAPIPLFVFRWSDRVTNAYLEGVREFMCERAFSTAKGLARDGLAILVYVYPNVPIRVWDLQDDLESGGGRLEELAAAGISMSDTVSGWIDLFSRLIRLGFLPCDHTRDEVGQAFRYQNAVIDGGFVDWDSLTDERLLSDRDLDLNWEMSIRELHSTIAHFLFGVDPSGSAMSTQIVNRIYCELRARLLNDAPQLPKRLAERVVSQKWHELYTRSVESLAATPRFQPEFSGVEFLFPSG